MHLEAESFDCTEVKQEACFPQAGWLPIQQPRRMEKQSRVRKHLLHRSMRGRKQVCPSATHTHTHTGHRPLSVSGPKYCTMSVLNIVAATTLMGTDSRRSCPKFKVPAHRIEAMTSPHGCGRGCQSKTLSDSLYFYSVSPAGDPPNRENRGELAG